MHETYSILYFLESGIETNNFTIRVCRLSFSPARAKYQNDAQMTAEAAPIRNSVRGRTEFCKITMTSGRGNLCFPTSTPPLTAYRRLPPCYKFLSPPSLPLPLNSKMVATTFVKKIPSTYSPKLRLLCRLTARCRREHVC